MIGFHIATACKQLANFTLFLVTIINQFQVGCCGADGANDYLSLQQPLPSQCRDTVTGNPFYHGCVDELTWFFEEKCAWVVGLAMTVCFIHVSIRVNVEIDIRKHVGPRQGSLFEIVREIKLFIQVFYFDKICKNVGVCYVFLP